MSVDSVQIRDLFWTNSPLVPWSESSIALQGIKILPLKITVGFSFIQKGSCSCLLKLPCDVKQQTANWDNIEINLKSTTQYN